MRELCESYGKVPFEVTDEGGGWLSVESGAK
jgi:hypothetical protein